MVGRVVVGCLGCRIRGVLVVDRVVRCCAGGCLALLVCVSCGAVRGSPLERRLSRRCRLVVVIVNDNDLLGQAVLVEVGPVRMPPLPFAGRSGRTHVGVGGLCEGRQLLWVSAVGARGSADIRSRIRDAASVAVVHGIAYSSAAIRDLVGIGQAGLVCLVVRIELVMGREGCRGSGRRGHGARRSWDWR